MLVGPGLSVDRPCVFLFSMETGQRIGVDGCRGGWFAVAVDVAGTVRCRRFACFADLVAESGHGARIGVDIPVGLPSHDLPFRECDRAARRLLGRGLTSRVFSPPSRHALAAACYREACAANRAEVGKALSLQSFHIMAKIREVDTFLRQHPAAAARILEFHPELVFMRLNGGVPVRMSKKRRAGRDMRLALIAGRSREVESACEAAFLGFPRRNVARDDILDAAAIAVALHEPAALRTAVPAPAPRDHAGLPMQIHY